MRLIERSHGGVWPSVDIGNFPSSETLTSCVNLYFRHFHDWLPVLDKRETDRPTHLLLAMCAIGAMYSQEGLSRVGIALAELVRRSVFFIVRPLADREAETYRGNTIIDSCSTWKSYRPASFRLTVVCFAALKSSFSTPRRCEERWSRVVSDCICYVKEGLPWMHCLSGSQYLQLKRYLKRKRRTRKVAAWDGAFTWVIKIASADFVKAFWRPARLPDKPTRSTVYRGDCCRPTDARLWRRCSILAHSRHFADWRPVRSIFDRFRIQHHCAYSV